ncbi:MAG: hypothetical protein LBD75_04835 [Candidatus Peribacteria bacterium]|nr:hypothetical protein [Candidatus Peribacteria bacterium]
MSGGLCTFTGNGDFTFTFSDAYGNTGSEKAEVYWISNLTDKYLMCASITDIPERECTALVDFYYATNGDTWIK